MPFHHTCLVGRSGIEPLFSWVKAKRDNHYTNAPSDAISIGMHQTVAECLQDPPNLLGNGADLRRFSSNAVGPKTQTGVSNSNRRLYSFADCCVGPLHQRPMLVRALKQITVLVCVRRACA